MSLSRYSLTASVAVSNMSRARNFYEGRLGLILVAEQTDGSRIYASGGHASLHIYPSPASVGNSPATVATWYVRDLDQVVAELASNDVDFKRYDEPGMKTDQKGIFASGDVKVAWFDDPDGNTFAIEESDGISL